MRLGCGATRADEHAQHKIDDGATPRANPPAAPRVAWFGCRCPVPFADGPRGRRM